MRSARSSLAAGLLAAGLLLAGCGGDGWPSAAGPVAGTPPTTPPPTPLTTTAPPPPPSTSADAPAEDTPSSSAPAPDPGPGGAGRCTGADLDAAAGRTTGEAGQRHTTVVWTNTSARPCTMTGFGGVDLRGPGHPRFGPSWSLPRSAAEPTTVRLAPGGTAHTVIRWLPGDWRPARLVITPPDETRPKTLPWPGSGIQRQDGATRPGSYLDPVAPGSG